MATHDISYRPATQTLPVNHSPGVALPHSTTSNKPTAGRAVLPRQRHWEIPSRTRRETLISVLRPRSIYRVGELRFCKPVDAVGEKMQSGGRCNHDKEVMWRG